MRLGFGAQFDQKLKGYFGVTGYCYDVDALLKDAIPEIIHQGQWLITHGKEDSVLPVERTREQMNSLVSSGFNLQYLEFHKDHTMDLKGELELIRNWNIDKMKS